MPLEMCRIERERVPREQPLVTVAAFAPIAQALRRHTVEPVTVRAGDRQRYGHALTIPQTRAAGGCT